MRATELGHPLVQDFTPKSYEGEPLNFYGTQDPTGRLYFGTSGSLLTYDGATWGKIPLEGAAFETRALCTAPDGTVYVGAIDLLGRLRPTPDGPKFESLLDRLPPEARHPPPILRAIAAGDTVYFVTRNSLLVWRNEAFTIIPQPDSPRRAFLAGNAIYVQGARQALSRVEGDYVVEVCTDSRLDGVVGLAAEPDGSLVAMTSFRGLFRIKGGIATAIPSELDGHWSENVVLNATRLPDQSWALAIRPENGGGVVFLGADGKFLTRLDENNGLPRPVAYNLFQDREDGLWLCLLAGLARVEAPAAFTIFDRANGLAGAAQAVFRHEGVLWAGTNEGLFRLVPGAAPRTPAHFERVQSGLFFSFVPDGAALLVGAANGVMRVTASGAAMVVPLEYGALAMLRRSSDSDRIWIGTNHGLRSARRDGTNWRDEGPLPGMEGQIRSMVEDPDGSLWLGVISQGFVHVTLSGATATERGTAKFTAYQGTHGLPAPSEQPTVLSWHDRTLFAGYECGLFRFDTVTEQFTPLTEAGALTRELKTYAPVAGIDSPNHLWLLEAKGPNNYTILRTAPSGPPQPLLRVLPTTSNYVRTFLEEKTPEGEVLWACGTGALLRIVVDQAWPKPTPFTAVVEAKGLHNGDRVPQGRNTFDFVFTAPRFKYNGYRRYETRLTGYETAFTPWSEERKRTFTNLPSGHYRFEARAKDVDNEFSSMGTLDFTVLAPWWATWWFISIASVSGIGSVVGITRWFANRALQRRIALLEAQSAVERERLRLARDLHDEVGSGLGRVILFAGEAQRQKTDPAQLDAALIRVQSAAQELVQHAREIVWAVSPQHDTLASLIERLGDYSEETLRAAGIACRVEAPTKIPVIVLGSESRHNLFLALKEAVHNCVKYSAAQSATLRFTIADDWLEIVLRDEGRGFAAGETRGTGHGHRNLSLRAEALGGSAKIDSAPGQGTTVTLRVPFQPAQPPSN